MNDKVNDDIYNHMVEHLKEQTYELEGNSKELQDYIQDLVYATDEPDLIETAQAFVCITHSLFRIERNKTQIQELLSQIMSIDYGKRHRK